MLDSNLFERYRLITDYITSTCKRYVQHYNVDLKVNVKSYGNKGSYNNSYKFEIRIEDYDFVPKDPTIIMS